MPGVVILPAPGGLRDPASNGVLVRSALNTLLARTITGTANKITVTNGDGVSGNPTLNTGSLVVHTDQANTWSTGAQDFGAATSLIAPKSAGYAPTAQGSLGYDTTLNAWVGGGAGTVKGWLPRILSISAPAEQLSNSTTADQDYTSIFPIPANYLAAGVILRISCLVQFVTDAAASTLTYYLKLGTTKVFSTGSNTPGNSITRSLLMQWWVFGTATPGASVNVNTTWLTPALLNNGASYNALTQPIALATNGTLNIVPGLTYGTNTGGETSTLLHAVVEGF